MENHKLCLDISQILNVVLGFSLTKHGNYIIIWIHVFNNTEKHKLLQ
jgi:hypothetical protein